jgi:anti-sigma-K factor RskA
VAPRSRAVERRPKRHPSKFRPPRAEDTRSKTWANHPFTRKTASIIADQVKAASAELLEACSKSTDPAVRGAYAKVNQTKVLATYFEKAGVK